MANTSKNSTMKSVFKWVGYVLGGLLVLLIILQLCITFFANDLAADYLKDTVSESSNRTYVLDFDDLSLNLFSGSATLEKVRIDADTTSFARKTTPGFKPPQTLFQGSVEEIYISGVDVFEILWGDALNIGTITISRPQIHARQNPRNIPADTSSQFSTVDSSLYAALSNRFSALNLDYFAIENGNVAISKSSDTLRSARQIDLTLHDIQVDSASAQSGRLFVTDSFSFNMQNFRMNKPGGLYNTAVGELDVSTSAQHVLVDSFQLIPRYPRFEFSERNGAEIDRLDITVPKIKMQRVDFSRFIDSARFYAQKIQIDSARMEDFRDKNPIFPRNNRPPIPHMAFKELDQKIKIDTVTINDSYIAYSEYWYEAPQAGTITFEQLDATMYNVSNYPAAIESGQRIVMDARTRVMGRPVLNAHFEFPMDSKNGFHTVSGTLSQTPLPVFNPILEYVAFARIDEGMLNRMKFDMTLNDNSSNGTLVMNYENLKISVLDKKSIEQKGFMENLKTFAANTFVLKSSNTPEGGMRTGTIGFERIQRKSVFNYWWKSLLSGIKESVGV